LNQLKSFEAINCACIIIRYFGGTKLGKSGLIKAYGGTAKACLQKTALKTIVLTRKFSITYPYSAQSQINRIKNNFDMKEIEATYMENVTIEVACRLQEASAFLENIPQLEHLGIQIEKLNKSFVVFNN